MKKILAIALLGLAVPAFAHAGDEAKPADKSAKKSGKKADKTPAGGEEKKDAPAGDEKK